MRPTCLPIRPTCPPNKETNMPPNETNLYPNAHSDMNQAREKFLILLQARLWRLVHLYAADWTRENNKLDGPAVGFLAKHMLKAICNFATPRHSGNWNTVFDSFIFSNKLSQSTHNGQWGFMRPTKFQGGEFCVGLVYVAQCATTPNRIEMLIKPRFTKKGSGTIASSLLNTMALSFEIVMLRCSNRWNR